jgi:vacuole morphology and inheritance protein 14
VTPVTQNSTIAVATARNLNNNLYDKRKLGGLEIEQMVKELHGNGARAGVLHVIKQLNVDFIQSTNGNAKKGGLIALAAVAISLGGAAAEYVEQLLPPVLSCFTDQDMRTRYYACESLYNIAKIARGSILAFFNEVFDGLCKLSADPDPNVKNAAMLLDRLVKDIVTEVGTFDVERFIPLLRERITVINPFCRMFIVQWLSVLDAVPDIDLLRYLPELLGGLFAMLQDTSAGIRTAVDTLLADFLREIRDEPAAVDLGSLIQTLLAQCSAQDDFTRLTALVYVTEFVEIGGKALLPFTAKLVKGVLPSVAHASDNIAGAAVRANDALLALVRNAKQIDGVLPELLDALLVLVAPSVSPQSSDSGEPAAAAAAAAATTTPTDAGDGAPIAPRLAALRWLTVMHALAPGPLGQRHASLLAPLLEAAADGTELLARRALELLATLADDAARLDALLSHVVRRLARDASLLDNRGALIVRHLCLHVAPERVLRRMAKILEAEADLDFATVMIDTLNLILLTAPELTAARRKLRGLTEAASADFFSALYGSWAHSPAALLSLCLLCGVYEHAAQLVTLFADVPITVGFLMQIDKLVQLLESPVFVHLRLQLLEPESHAYLFKTLYGILMLLPQSAAFELLRTRLNSVSTLGTLQLIPKAKTATPAQTDELASIKFADLRAHFSALQSKHQAHFEQGQRSSSAGI